jgi:hypothetical protein
VDIPARRSGPMKKMEEDGVFDGSEFECIQAMQTEYYIIDAQ